MIAAAKPGLSCRDLAKLADAERGSFQLHPLAGNVFGNSIGLALDEPPILARDSNARLEAGAVYLYARDCSTKRERARPHPPSSRDRRRLRRSVAGRRKAMNGIDELAALIVRLRTADLAAATLDKLRLHVADTIGAWIAATKTQEGKQLIAFRHRESATGDAVADDLATHCALVRLSEIDDIDLASMTTPGSIVIPAAMTLAATLPDADVGDVAAAMLAGYEAMIRLGLAIKGPNILYRGIWPTYFAAGFATAAVAARLMRLDEGQTAHALALALNMAAPAVGQHHAATTARWFLAGNAAREGLMAALRRASRLDRRYRSCCDPGCFRTSMASSPILAR